MSPKKQILLLFLAVWRVQGSDKSTEPNSEPAINETPITRMVGGAKAADGSVPFLVSIRTKKDNWHFCGGSIVDYNWILTSAECIKDKKPADIIIVAGTNSRQRGCEIYDLNKFFIHPNFSSNPRKDDLALMKTAKVLSFSNKVGRIDLPFRDTSFGQKSHISGWGFINKEATNYVDPLLTLEVTVQSSIGCRKDYKDNVQFPVTYKHICTFRKEGEGACLGDLGGGLEYDNELIGVLSWVTKCARGKPDVFTRVFEYKGWIRTTMTKNT